MLSTSSETQLRALVEEVAKQIDGAIVAGHLHCLIERKNEINPLAIAPIAKMRNQLQRRPPATIGLIFSTSGYTEPVQTLARYLGSQTILLWHPAATPPRR